MRTRLLLVSSVALIVLGTFLGTVAAGWLAANWAPGPHIYDLDGFKQYSMARAGEFIAAGAVFAGVALGVLATTLSPRSKS